MRYNQEPKVESSAILSSQTYSRFIKPLSELKGLRRCFVRASWPYPWSTEDQPWHHRIPDSANIVKFEQYFERLIMGDGYNSTVLGKMEENLGQWQEVMAVPLMYI
jgi:hypothetical protein